MELGSSCPGLAVAAVAGARPESKLSVPARTLLVLLFIATGRFAACGAASVLVLGVSVAYAAMGPVQSVGLALAFYALFAATLARGRRSFFGASRDRLQAWRSIVLTAGATLLFTVVAANKTQYLLSEMTLDVLLCTALSSLLLGLWLLGIQGLECIGWSRVESWAILLVLSVAWFFAVAIPWTRAFWGSC